MQNRSLSEFRQFCGFLEANGSVAPITFRARINSSGEVEFDEIAINKETSFIEGLVNNVGSSFSRFSLSAKSEVGIGFKTESLFFTSSELESDEAGDRMYLTGVRCSRAMFHRKIAEPKPKPLVRMLLKGFKSSHPLNLKCRLGTIYMAEYPPDVEPDAITGFIIVESDNEHIDLSVWHGETNKLLDHVRRVMSFASGLMLSAPIIEFYADDNLEVMVSSQIQQISSASFPVFSYVNRQPIFEAAVTSFFNPPLVAENLFIAIDWFAMDSTYAEVRLVNAMTVLENLIASNLGESDMLILPDKKEFEKYRRTLRKVLKQCIKKWSTDETKKSEDILSDINERLADLNRRSILKNVDTLVERCSVPLEGISKEQIQAAKNARDLIVHRGHYDKEDRADLWKHAMVVREIVIRFLFTAIGYQGKYISHLGSYHDAWFPPKGG